MAANLGGTMKRLAATVICGLAFTLVWAAVAGASAVPGHTDIRHVQRCVASGPAGSSVTAGAPTYTVSGTLEAFDGTPVANAWVTCGWYNPDGNTWFLPAARYYDEGDAVTAADGSFSIAGVPSHPGHDSIMAGPASGAGFNYMVMYHLDFSTTDSYVLRPGHVNVSVAHAPVGKRAHVSFGDSTYSAADSSVGLTDGYGVATAWPPDFTSARASFDNPNGTITAECEWMSPGLAPVVVDPGTTADATVAFNWRSAVRGRILGAQCRHSGRPGSTIKYSVSHVPAGQQISFYGQSWSPSSWALQTYPRVVTSTGTANTYTVALRIPARAPVGDVYEIEAQRSDDVQSMLWLYDYYEVCSFAASQSVIARGQTVRVGGHIDGLQATLFMRHRRAGQPSTVKAVGWTKVANLSVSAGGHFLSPRLLPSHTTWYVVRYSGGNGGFTAFTPVVRVSVR